MGIDFNGKNIEAVVFDLDGTFYEIGSFTKFMFFLCNISNFSLFSAHRSSMSELRKEDFGSGEQYFDTLFDLISKKSGVEKNKVKKWYLNDFRKDFIRTLRKFCRKNKALEKITEVLRSLNVRTAVLSDFGFIEERLDALHIDKELFDVLVSGEEEGALKPQTRPLKKISVFFSVDASNTALIGDRTDTDKMVADRAGMMFIDVRNTGELENILNNITGVSL